MHEFPPKSSLTNRLRRALIGISLAVLLASLCLSPMAQRQNATAAPNFDCGNVTEIPQTECEALVAFYESTGGPNWSINTGWLETNTPCSWYGVSCQPGSVYGINLGPICYKVCDGSMNLTGSIPPEIGNLSRLEFLDLSMNNISYLPGEIGNLSSLSELSLRTNNLTSIPPEIGNLSKLTMLDLGVNQLTDLPPEIGNLSNLTSLNILYNQLTSLPPDIGNLSKLWVIGISNNQLMNLPPEFGNLDSLEKLLIYNNQLTNLPPEFGKLKNLTELDLSGNKLTGLPPEFGNLTNLTDLYLSGNQLSSLPPEFGNLSNLLWLDLYANSLSSLPPEFVNLSDLETLFLQSNQINFLPPEFSKLSKLVALALDDNQLTSLPSEIGNLTNLNMLSLANNQLTSLPPEVGNLANLDVLILANNRLTSLPHEIGNLTNLTRLDLDGNLLNSLPSEIGNLTDLGGLNLDGNLLNSLPTEITNLSNLRFLYLSSNQLSNLPPAFTNLSNLWELDLSYNRLTINDPYLLYFLIRFSCFPYYPNCWMNTQTVAPSTIQLRSATPISLGLAWTPIRYSVGGGYYEISYATEPNGPFVVHGTTADKTSDDYLAGGLSDSTTYYVRIRTYSQAHDDQLHDLWSEYSPPIAILTTPIDPVIGATLNYTNEQGLATTVEAPPEAVGNTGALYFSTQTDVRLPLMFASTGRAFNLGIYQNDSYTDDLLLSSPITLTLDYDESHWIEENLELIFWDSTTNTWIDAAQTCFPRGTNDRQLDQNRLVVTACRLGKYALVEVQSASYLPIVYQD